VYDYGHMNLAVYTVALGNEFQLPFIELHSGVDYICFTDKIPKDSLGWEIRLVEPIIPADLPRSSREYKIRPHRWLHEYKDSLYIDTKVQLFGNPAELWSLLITEDEDISMGFIGHSFRETLKEEFREVMMSNLDSEVVVRQQIEDYSNHHSELLNMRPVWGGIIARRHNQQSCIDAMECWMENVLRYSRRDQLSILVALQKNSFRNLKINSIDNHGSQFHTWPIGQNSRSQKYLTHYFDKVLEQKLSTILSERDAISALLERAVLEAKDVRDAAVAARNSAVAERNSAVAERDSAVAERDKVLNSTIWKLFKPYRKLKDIFLR